MVHAHAVIVGSGIAGLSASLAALELGAQVTVLDRAPEHEAGGNSRWTEAFMRMQSISECSVDLEDRLLSDHMGYPDPSILAEAVKDSGDWSQLMRTLDVVDGEVVARLATEAGPTLNWLMGFGLKFDALPTPFMTQSTTRISPVGGGLELVERLTREARSRGADFRFGVTARSLIQDADGRVRGLRTDSGEEILGSVVLACGGFEGNPEMLARYMGSSALNTRPVARGGYFNKGEGIEMALAAGAASAGNYSLFHAEPIDPRSGMAEAAIFAFPHGVLVNDSALRFTDEAPGPVDAWYERITRKIHGQSHGIAHLILDQQALRIPNISAGLRTDQPPVTADDFVTLGERIGIPGDVLASTVLEYNQHCVEGAFDATRPDGLATSGLRIKKSNWARPLTEAPFVAYPIIAANVFTFGGLRIDCDARVINRSGRVIEGLFAAGEITGMYYTNYTGSTSVLRGAVFGRIAGHQAAKAA